jgi:hypothetical protein
MRKFKYKRIVLTGLIIVWLLIIFGSYSAWNSASPEKTCASCHEIQSSVSSFMTSAHRELACAECHGTALSNGIHSLKEKANMVFTHIGGDVKREDIRMNEAQVLAMQGECARCHQSEHANWLAGGHSTTYSRIFLDSIHNSMEPPYADCLRCHGMFYDKSIHDLVEPISRVGPYSLKDENKGTQPAVPCLACHQVHTPNEILSQQDPNEPRDPPISLYMRADKMHLRANKLLKPRIFHEGREVLTSDDYAQRLCLNCHSPNFAHESGFHDDRTPRGVHEGFSCNSCHKTHSNDTRNSCVACHTTPSSNCKLDVRVMNTTYADPNSSNNIHFVSCSDCHDNAHLK